MNWAGSPVIFATNSARVLLTYLAVEAGRPHPRELLASLLWPNQTMAAAFSNLRQTLVRLRKAFPDPSTVASFLTITPHTLELKHEAITTDLAQFEDLLARCAAHGHDYPSGSLRCPECLARLKSAADLYRGEFLQGLFLEGSEPFEEWLHFKREVLHRQAVQVLQLLTQAHEQAGEYAEMGNFAARQLAMDPLREEAHAAMMRSLVLTGDRNAALKQYETCRKMLANELGIEPNTETTALFEQIRQGAFPPVAPVKLPKHNLPASLTPFVGRDAELAVLENTGDGRLLTLVGAGGMGKTRLALRLGYNFLPVYRDGVFLVSLGPLSDPATIAPAIAAALGISVHGGDPRSAVLHALSEKHLLLILDNFEHLLDGVDIVVDILEAAPLVKILATSRERLNIRGEHYYTLQGLPFEPGAGMADAANMEAVRLFVQCAQRVKPDFNLNAANVGGVLRICQLVQGMPLGLELAAAWIETLPVEVIAAEVEQSTDFLSADWRDAPQRHRSLRAVFEWSWQLLTGNERQVFKRLSIFRGGFTSEAALAVAGATVRILNSLQRKSLLRRREAAGTTGWYDIHEVLRQFAAEALTAEAGEFKDTAAKHSAFYLTLIEEAETKFYSRDQVLWLDHIEREHENTWAALAWLETCGDFDAALRLAGSLRYFWFVRGYHREGSEQLLRILAQPASGGPDATRARVQALNAAGYLQWVRGKEDEAGRLLEEAIRYSRAIEYQPGTAFALCYLGAVTNAHEDYAKATGFLEESLFIWRKLQKENDIGLALMFLGDSMLGLGTYDRARALFSESAAILKRLGNTSVLPYPLRRLGYEAHRVGKLGQAITFYAESMTLNMEVGDRQGVAASLVGLAGVAGDCGNWPGAARMLGAVDSMLEAIQTQLLPFDHKQRNRLLTLVQAQRDKSALEIAWQEGKGFTVEQAIEAAGDLISAFSRSEMTAGYRVYS